jgi:ATP-dependent Clp protease ATP-binding subunit ClpA
MRSRRTLRIPHNETRRVLLAARGIARNAGVESIEAEHLLIALACVPHTVASVVLNNAGLDADRIADALALEQMSSLSTVGVTSIPQPPPVPVPDVKTVGQSTRLAMHRGMVAARARRERRMRAAHLLIGVLSADVGRVPRALAAAGIDRGALLAETHGALDNYLSRAS